MAKTKPKFMLIEHGRYFYQRKIPLEFQRTLGRKKWRAPLGADFDQAYTRLQEIRKEHDALLEGLKEPEAQVDFLTTQRRIREAEEIERNCAQDRTDDLWCAENGVKTDAEELEDFKLEGFEEAPIWEQAEGWMKALEYEKTKDHTPTKEDIESTQDLLRRLSNSQGKFKIELPPHPEFKALVAKAPEAAKSKISFMRFTPVTMDDDEYYDRLVEVQRKLFGENNKPPSDPDDRDAYDFVKMKLERRIARVARDPNTISKVSIKYFAFAQLREKTQNKYERTIARFIKEVGDLPLGQVTSQMLREYREHLKTTRGLLPSSVRAEFTPMMGLFDYATDEELIKFSPMVSVKLPKERRAIEESKWLPFSPHDVQHIFAALDDVWGQPMQGLSTERREALTMAVRVLAFTAMRPAEFMALRPDQIDDRAIRVEGGKTKSAWRVIPLHPEIYDFPEWLQSGGLDAFKNHKTGKEQTDPVAVLRSNFTRLIREKMAHPIENPRKVLYSLRSAFQNSMRRSGAPKDVRRAILGHVESGAMRHYDDGPSFELLKKWIHSSDPRRP